MPIPIIRLKNRILRFVIGQKMKKTFLFVSLFLVISVRANSQWSILNAEADSIVLQGMNYIYNMDFANATRCFTDVQGRYPEHPAGYFLDAMQYWWKILIDKDNADKYKNTFLKKIDKTIAVCDSILERYPTDINALFFKAGAIGYRGRFWVEDKSWVSAVRDGDAAFELLKQCLFVAPSNRDIMLGTGIYNYFAAAIPEQYPIVKPLMLLMPSGDKKVGEMQLLASAKSARYASVEAKVVLLQLYYSFENRPYECLPITEELHQKYPNNPYFKKYYARSLVRTGQWFNFEEIWREILTSCLKNEFGYDRQLAREAMYYIGIALERKSDYNQALRYFYKCDEGCRSLDKDGPSSYMSMTNLHIGKIYDKQSKRELAIKQYKKVLNMPNYNSSHADANRYIKEAYK